MHYGFLQLCLHLLRTKLQLWSFLKKKRPLASEAAASSLTYVHTEYRAERILLFADWMKKSFVICLTFHSFSFFSESPDFVGVCFGDGWNVCFTLLRTEDILYENY